MGEHAFYVIAAYGLTAVVIGGLVVQTLVRRAANRRLLDQLEAAKTVARSNARKTS